MAKPRRPVTKSGKPRARKGVKLKPTELGAQELRIDTPDAAIAALSAEVEKNGGQVLAVYREPLGGHVQMLAGLPVNQVEPTPVERDVPDSHVRQLPLAVDKNHRYLSHTTTHSRRARSARLRPHCRRLLPRCAQRRYLRSPAAGSTSTHGQATPSRYQVRQAPPPQGSHAPALPAGTP